MGIHTKTLYQDLCRLFPGGVSSPVRALYGAKRLPVIVKKAYKDIVEDIDDKTYIDFCASWGALILAHAEEGLVNELTKQLACGTSYGITNVYEHKLAKKITQFMPSIEMMRFCSSGTEATMFALRLARGVTGKDYIVKCIGNYHGSADFLLAEAGSGFATLNAASKGIPHDSIKYTLNLPYNDVDALEKLFTSSEYKDKIAAVIVEPVAGNMGVVKATQSYLKRLREITKQNQTLLIFDEVMTGFRVGLGGAQEFYDIDPDLTCLGKIIGGGFPAAVYGGKHDYMQQISPLGPIYQGGTLSGNPMAMAAGYYVMQQIEKPNFYSDLRKKTENFLNPIKQKLAEKKNLKACVQDIGSMFTIFFGVNEVQNMEQSEKSDKPLFWKFFNYLLDRGVYWSPSPYEACFMMHAHTEEHLKKTQHLILDFIDQI